MVLSQIGVGSLQFSVLKNISHNQVDLALCHDIMASALVLVGAISLLISCIGIFLANPISIFLNSPGVGQGLIFALSGLCFYTLNKVLINTINGLRSMKSYAVFRSLRYILIPITIFIILKIRVDAPYLLLSLPISEFILFLSLIIYVYSRLIPFQAISEFWFWIKNHLSFGGRGVFSGILIELNTRIDVLMLGYFTTDEMVGVYSFAAILAEGFGQLPLVLRWNIDPVIGSHFAKNQYEKISLLSKRIRSLFHPFMLGVGLLSVAIYRYLSKLLVSSDLTNSSWVVFTIIMVGVVINSGYKPLSGFILQAGRPGVFTILILGLVFGDALLNFVFIPLAGIQGAAIVTTLTYVFEAVALVILAKKLFGIRL